MWWVGCQSWVRMTWGNLVARALMRGMIESASATASLPPIPFTAGQKSFWRSMTRRASVSVMGGRGCMCGLMLVQSAVVYFRKTAPHPLR